MMEETRMAHKSSEHRLRVGFSLLELEVALVLFGLALAGLMPLVVIQSRQLRKLESRFRHETTYYLVPSTNRWAAKLGAACFLTSEAPSQTPAPPTTVINDGDPGYRETGTTWQTETRPDAYHESQRSNDPPGSIAAATWEFTPVEPGWYQVLVTWSARDDQADSVPYTVYDGELEKATIRVSQKAAPAGNNFEGLPWQSLGVFSITSNSLRVQVTSEATQTQSVKADAARIVPVKNELQLLSLEKSLTGEEVTAHMSVGVRIPQ
jgi:type II secretory pathway pseudopilin PulG